MIGVIAVAMSTSGIAAYIVEKHYVDSIFSIKGLEKDYKELLSDGQNIQTFLSTIQEDYPNFKAISIQDEQMNTVYSYGKEMDVENDTVLYSDKLELTFEDKSIFSVSDEFEETFELQEILGLKTIIQVTEGVKSNNLLKEVFSIEYWAGSEWEENAFGDVKEWSEDAIHTTGDFLSTVWGDVSDTAGDAWDWVLQTTDHFTETFADSFEAVDQWISMTGDNVTEFLKKQLYELMEKTGLDEAQAESVFGKLLAYAEEHNIPADKMIKLVLPYAVQLAFHFGDDLPEITDAAGAVNADAVSDFLISALTNMKVDSEEAADEALEELEEELEELSETDAD